jgi:ammonia channel protein AmtB
MADAPAEAPAEFNQTYINETVTQLSDPLIVNQGHAAWVLVSTALVFIMIPGLGYFYSGMARSKNALSLIMLSVLSLAVVSVQVFYHSISLRLKLFNQINFFFFILFFFSGGRLVTV